MDCRSGEGPFNRSVLRILSDLHLFDAGTQVRELRQLEPLLADVRTLVINGDSCEMLHGHNSDQANEMKRFLRERVPEVIFVTGNHDPVISDTHELLLADGRIWVTHGDICFDDLTPWSRHRDELVALVQAELDRDPTLNYHTIEGRLQVARAATQHLKETVDRLDPSVTARLVWIWHTLFPPRQPLAMLRAWRELPARAAALAVAQRPAAQVVVTGHVHLPGVWPRKGGPIIINTGSFLAPLGGHLVDLAGDTVLARRIIRREGNFRPGRQIARIELTK